MPELDVGMLIDLYSAMNIRLEWYAQHKEKAINVVDYA